MAWSERAVDRGFDLLQFLVQKGKLIDALKGIIKINEIARKIIDSSGASIDCLFLVAAHNGKVKSEDSLKFRSIVAGDYNDALMKNFDYLDFINIRNDKEYKDILRGLKENESVEIIVRNMRDGKTKTSFESQKWKLVEVFFIHATRHGLYHCMIATTGDGEHFRDSYSRQKVNVVLDKIKNIVTRF